MHRMSKTSPPLQNVRLTISITPEVHAAFTRLASARGLSISRTMGDWLDDTLDASAYLADTLEKARAAPRLVAQQLHAYAQGLADETGDLMDKVRADGRTRPLHAQKVAAGGGRLPDPPLCNTGGKVPSRKTNARPVKTSVPLPPAKVQAYANSNGARPKGTP
jgi:hypothetical protein